jgi:nicotinate-nucleotide adenylyltransferase
VAQPNGSGEQKRIGILGGTFDPIHNAHLAIAEEARKRLHLDEVLFVPAGQPWMKTDHPVTPAAHRAAMVQLAIRRRSYYKMISTEAESDGPSYTVETLRELRQKYGKRTELFFIMGWDSLKDFPQWKEPAAILKLATLVAFPRPGFARPDLAALEKKIPGISKGVVFPDKPEMDLSATNIRERIAKGLDVNELMPAAVADYIKENHLYKVIK